MKKQLLTLILIATTITATSQSWWNSKKIKGNGKVITKTRTVGSFDEVAVGGSFDVNLVQGKEGNITLEGEENILPYIVTEVKGGTLKIKFKSNTNINTTRRLLVTVAFDKIDGISLGGSGNVTSQKVIKAESVSLNLGGSGSIIADVDADTTKASIGGSGNIKIEGKTDNFKCSIAGSGSIKAYELQAKNLKANIAGSGSVKTTVSTRIKATVAGSGSVYYKGNPKYVDTNSIGSGDVIDRN
ncbi:conserved protein of unknown function [Tenacibaculum sp. 190130A14a]|uniref:DUF2807 domain-containing protein n=1 Tax=Tenacibaculum polynesiense TaxID=3137857 RepID=A0ABP1F140_9FLAO